MPEKTKRIPGVADIVDDAVRMHTLYVGSRDGQPFAEADRAMLTGTVRAAFDGFTLVEADGFFRGAPVATLLVKVAADETDGVRRLARDLAIKLEQEAVGLECDGRYERVLSRTAD